ncbi:MAG: SCO family protein [Lentimicrobium sp.]|nr:SCO family protein [Lentimicrobium sp.]MDD2528787.1 SCO family protein [Lentimicrobiaceae bacterium]MDY0024631.1 SCO family protein [Lentimicrobium sp.]
MNRRSIIVPLMSAILLLTFACTQQKEESSCCKTDSSPVTEPLPVSDNSLYLLTSDWETERNDVKKLEAYHGKVVVASMFFSNCASACPRITADMKNIEAGLSPEEQKKVQFLLITMDIKRDTPGQMKKYAADHQLKDNWELIRSDQSATMEMANVLGVRIQPTEGGGFDHSNIIHILNPEGELVYQQMGLNVDPQQSLLEIRKLL